MKLIGILASCVFALLHYSVGENLMTDCGQTLIADNGTIQYKLNQTYDANELCVFVIRFESGNINCTFTLNSDGVSDMDPNAITLFRSSQGLGQQYQLQGDVTFTGYGAVLIFRTNSSNGTGFNLSFKNNGKLNGNRLPGIDLVFNDETASPLRLPFSSNYTAENFHSFYFFTSGAKLIEEWEAHLSLTAKGVLRNVPGQCGNMFKIYSFENDLKLESMICWDEEDQVLQFSTQGLFLVHHQQVVDSPIATGMFTWEKISAS